MEIRTKHPSYSLSFEAPSCAIRKLTKDILKVRSQILREYKSLYVERVNSLSQHLKGHAGHTGNDIANNLARKALKEQELATFLDFFLSVPISSPLLPHQLHEKKSLGHRIPKQQ